MAASSTTVFAITLSLTTFEGSEVTTTVAGGTTDVFASTFTSDSLLSITLFAPIFKEPSYL